MVEERGGRSIAVRSIARRGTSLRYRDRPMPKRLVIVESPAKAKTIAGYLGAGLRRRVLHRPHPRPARTRRRHPGEVQGEPWARLGVDVDNGFEPLYVVDPDKKKTVAELKQAARGRRRAPARDGRGPRGRGDRLAPARGAEAEGARPADGLPRDHARRDRAGARRDARASTSGSSTRRRRGASSTGSTATRSRRCCGRRSCRGCRPAACSRSRPASSSSASASGWRSAPPRTGTSSATFDPDSFEARLVALDGQRVAHRARLRPRREARAATRRQLDEDAARGLADRLEGASFQRRPRRARSRTRAARARRS